MNIFINQIFELCSRTSSFGRQILYRRLSSNKLTAAFNWLYNQSTCEWKLHHQSYMSKGGGGRMRTTITFPIKLKNAKFNHNFMRFYATERSLTTPLFWTISIQLTNTPPNSSIDLPIVSENPCSCQLLETIVCCRLFKSLIDKLLGQQFKASQINLTWTNATTDDEWSSW